MQPSAHRHRRSMRPSWEAVFGFCTALALFAFYQRHGVSERDRFFIFELSATALAFALSVWSALRAFKHHGKWNRRIGLVTFAVLLITLLIATLLDSMTEPPKPQRIEYGE